ncbi:MAG TPA: AAA family ATPase [Blastocatellia bacterium]|nr:AAA family ATPase [Blastocatellia bacterium]
MIEMIDSLEINNFRCFRSLSISSLGRVNLIAGVNNAGKTALLEAIYLLASPNLPIWPPPLNFLRGLDKLPPNVDLRTRWGWLFRQRDVTQPISIRWRTNDEITDAQAAADWRSLDIRWQPIDDAVRFGESPENNQDGLVVLSSKPKGATSPDIVSVTRAGFTRPEREVASIPLGVISGAAERGFEEDARRFSEMYLLPGGSKPVMEALRVLEPRLVDLRVLNLGGISMLYGEIGIGRPVPLSQMGEGVGRILSMVLEITRAAGGIVLIDEVEHGLHHSAMERIWKVIDHAARQSNVQVFATTHSWECIQAAHMAFEQDPPYDLRLYRLERAGEDVKVISYDRETLGTSVDMDLEVR